MTGPLFTAVITPTPVATATASDGPNPLDNATAACRQGAFVCSHVRQWTGSYETGLWAQVVLEGAAKIIAIVVLGWLLRIVASRLVKECERRALNAGGGTLTGWTRRMAGDTATVTSARRIQRVRSAGSVVRNAITVLIWSTVALMVLSQLGLNIAPLLASAGIIGVAIGFGAQSLVKDFLTGLFMILEDQYGVGDRVDFGDAKGTVVAVGMRITRVRADDSTMWYVPNGSITRVGNLGQGWGRAVVNVELTQPHQTRTVEDVLNEAAERISMDEEWADALSGAAEMVSVAPVPHDCSTVQLAVKTMPGRQWGLNRALTAATVQAAEVRGLELRELPVPTQAYVVTDPPSPALQPKPAPGPLDPATSRLAVGAEPDGQPGRATSHNEP